MRKSSGRNTMITWNGMQDGCLSAPAKFSRPKALHRTRSRRQARRVMCSCVLAKTTMSSLSVLKSRAERPGPGLGPVASRMVEHVAGLVLVGRELVNESNFKILVGVDGSGRSRNAIEALRTNFNLDEAQVTLMHVIEKPWLRLSLEPDEPEAEKLFGSELRREAEQIIEDARALLGASEVSTEARIEEGIPGNELLHEAEIGDYDLAVVGATGISDLKHTMLGSVAFKVAWTAPCPVAVAR
jgi:universal stress protein A